MELSAAISPPPFSRETPVISTAGRDLEVRNLILPLVISNGAKQNENGEALNAVKCTRHLCSIFLYVCIVNKKLKYHEEFEYKNFVHLICNDV